jgi:signal transduction histidine kinase
MSTIGNAHLREECMSQAPAAPDRPAAPASGPEMLATGVLAIRWALVVWMGVLSLSGAPELPPAALRVAVLLLAIGVSALHTLRRPAWSAPLLLIDLVVALVVAVTGIRYGSFASVFPAMAVLQWGAAHGMGGGLVAGAIIGTALISTRLLTGLLPNATGLGLMVRTAADAVNLVLAGAGFGFVATLLRRSARDLHAAQAAEVAARERAARLTERESLGRQIHDSVLQVLTLVHKRGRELAAREQVPRAEVARLADLAAAQERTLRSLILRPPEERPIDDRTASLRAALEAAAAQVSGDLDVQVTAVGESLLPDHHVQQVRAAVEQALHNVVQHAGARRAWVFVDDQDSEVTVSIRDDGHGFVYDERQLRADGKYGLLRSICGRVTDLGGTARVDTAPGRGTEVELRVPRPTGDDDRTAGDRKNRD